MLRPIVVTLTSLIFLPVAGTWQLSFSAEVDWPGWRGPGRDGWVSGFRPPTRWPQRLERAWQVEVGTGYASPVVSGGRVYQHARQGDDEVVWCFALDAGTVKWRQSYAAPFKMGSGAERHGKGPKSSPALADGRLFCLDPKTGEVLWQGPGRTGENVALLAIPGHVAALINDGELKIIAASGDRFETVASYRVAQSPTWAPPVLLDSGILVKDHETLTLWTLTSAAGRSPSHPR